MHFYYKNGTSYSLLKYIPSLFPVRPDLAKQSMLILNGPASADHQTKDKNHYTKCQKSHMAYLTFCIEWQSHPVVNGTGKQLVNNLMGNSKNTICELYIPLD